MMPGITGQRAAVAPRTCAPQLMPPHPSLPAAVRQQMLRAETDIAKPWNAPLARVLQNSSTPGEIRTMASGNKLSPCILMQFSDQANTYTTADIQALIYTPGGVPTGSVHDYFVENSYRTLSLTGQATGWYTTANAKASYGFSRGYGAYADCAYEAAQQADAAGFDWAPYDTDHDGYVDHLFVMHSGVGAEESGDSDDIWTHSWDFVSAGKEEFVTSTDDPYNPGQMIKINNYSIVPESSYYSGGEGIDATLVGIGTLCHEFGHAFGLPDLYDTGGSGYGLGTASVMAMGSWGATAMMAATPPTWTPGRKSTRAGLPPPSSPSTATTPSMPAKPTSPATW